MDPELLRLLLQIFGSPGDANDSPDNSPYIPALTSYLDNYYSAIGENSETANTSADTSIGGSEPDLNIAGQELYRPTGIDPVFDIPSFGGRPEHGGWGTLPNTYQYGIDRAGLGTGNFRDGQTGVHYPIHFEDGSTIPGEVSPAVQAQLVTGPFQQFPASGRSAPSAVLSLLENARDQARTNGTRLPGAVPIQRSLGYGNQLMELARGFDQMSGGSFYPPPGGNAGNVAPSTTQGLFGGGQQPPKRPAKAITQPQRQPAQQGTRQAAPQLAARPTAQPQQQRTFSAPAPTFTNAPASRSAAQNSLANTLNLMRSLVRR